MSPEEGVDYGELTPDDVVLMAIGLLAGAEPVDFSEFYRDDEA